MPKYQLECPKCHQEIDTGTWDLETADQVVRHVLAFIEDYDNMRSKQFERKYGINLSTLPDDDFWLPILIKMRWGS